MTHPEQIDSLRQAVELVRSGEEIAPAAEMMGVTVSALRTACRLAAVSPPSAAKSRENHQKTRERLTASCLHRFRAGESAAQIRDREGVTLAFVHRVLTQAGIPGYPPPRLHRRPRSSEKSRRADALARTWLDNRGTPKHVSITTLAKQNHLSTDTVATAIRRVKAARAARKLLDPNGSVNDTPVSRT